MGPHQTYLNCPFCPSQSYPRHVFASRLMLYSCTARHQFYVFPEEEESEGKPVVQSKYKMDPELVKALESARHHVMTDEEKEAQRQSWVKGEMGLDRGDDGYGKTTVFKPIQDGNK